MLHCWIREELKARWMLHALDHGEILGAIDQGASYRSGTKRWISETLDGGNIDVRDVVVGYVLHLCDWYYRIGDYDVIIIMSM